MGFSSNRRGTCVPVEGSSSEVECNPSGGGDIIVLEDNVVVAGNLTPCSDTSHNLGSETKRWSNLYTGDLHLKNERGDWTIFEEEDGLTVKNNLTGEFFNLMLEKLKK